MDLVKYLSFIRIYSRSVNCFPNVGVRNPVIITIHGPHELFNIVSGLQK